MACQGWSHLHLVQAGGGHSLVNVKPGGAGDREKGGPTYTGPERGNRSDQALVLTLGLLCAHTVLVQLHVSPCPPQKLRPFHPLTNLVPFHMLYRVNCAVVPFEASIKSCSYSRVLSFQGNADALNTLGSDYIWLECRASGHVLRNA